MTSDSETAPLPEPVSSPTVPQASSAPGSTPAPAAPAPAAPVPVTASPGPAVAPPRRRNRILGTVGQVVAVIGIVVCLLLAVGAVMGRGWAVDTVDSVATTVDTRLAEVPPKLDAASQKIAEVSGRIGAIGDAVQGIAENPGTVGQALQGLLGAVNGLSEKYLALRQDYAEMRSTITNAIGAAQTIDRLIPGIDIPQEPIDKLNELDARFTEFDSTIMGVINAIPADGSVTTAITGLADKIAGVETRISDVSAALGDASARVETLRADIASLADTVRLGITLGTLGAILLLAYLALLHWVLFRWSALLKTKP